jgi:ubiquitin-protein ligase
MSIQLTLYERTSMKRTMTVFAVLLMCLTTVSSVAQTLQANLPITDGSVRAVLFNPAENIIYIGGSFNYVGPNTGNGVGIDNSTGNTVSGFPYVNGDIYAVVPDGSGGWYIGGEFTSVGGVVRNNIAHISADKSVDNSWNPNASSNIRALVLSPDGSTVYAGGYFSTIGGGATRNYIAAIRTSDGTATDWDPNANLSVWALAVSPDGLTVYAGGQFTSIKGVPKNYIAAIDASTGSAISWHPDANYHVIALAVSGDGSTVYAGGYFNVSKSSPSIGGADRNYIAALSASTGLATDWDPNANGGVCALAVSGATVYAGGAFTTIGEKLHRSA